MGHLYVDHACWLGFSNSKDGVCGFCQHVLCSDMLDELLDYNWQRKLSVSISDLRVLSHPHRNKVLFSSGVQVLSLQPPSFLSSLQSLLRTSSGSNQDLGEFSCAFSDEGMRITKGDRGELRVFVRDDTQTYI